jgi:rRNA pseudouridine-1189 N-methylase Emg1 (Nep1/Mra1 family)
VGEEGKVFTLLSKGRRIHPKAPESHTEAKSAITVGAFRKGKIK